MPGGVVPTVLHCRRFSVVDSEVSDEGDGVAVGVGDCGQLYSFDYVLDSSWSKALASQVREVRGQAVDGEVEKCCSRSIGIFENL